MNKMTETEWQKKQKNENKKTQAIEHTTDEENFSIKNTI